MTIQEQERQTESSTGRLHLSGDFSANGDEIALSHLWTTLVRRKRVIAYSTLIAAGVSAAIAFLLPLRFTAEAVILTPQQSQSSLTSMAQLAGIGMSAALPASLLSGFNFHNPTDLYVGILESRTIADALIARFDLKQAYDAEDLHATRKRLARNTSIKSGRDTLIHIRVEDADPKRAAQVANGYVEELSRQNATVALTEASQRRLFYEHQLVKEKDALADAEVALRNTQQQTGLVAPTGQAEALMRSLSQLQAEVLRRQAQVDAMKNFAADDNPRFQAATRELNTLRAEMNRLEQGKHVSGSPELPAGELPQVGLEYIRKYRDVKYHEALFEILSKQYEAARLDEAKSAGLVQTIDRAIPPERKSWPPRALMIIGAALLAALVSSGYFLVQRGPNGAR